jgi:hypothetical protein
MTTTKPTLVHAIAWTTLASGIINILFGIGALSTFIGFVCAPISIIPIIFGAIEIGYAAKLFNNQPRTFQPSSTIAVLEIACILFANPFSMIVGILSLIFYNDPVVKNYFSGDYQQTAPEPAIPQQPASLPDPKPDPVMLEPAAPLEETLPAEEPPAPPKRTPRKMAKK